MDKKYYGVLTKSEGDYILYSHEGEINITEELKSFWQKDQVINIKIYSDEKVHPLLNESDCYLEYRRDNTGEYKMHGNIINIDNILDRSLGHRLDIIIRWRNGENANDTKIIHKS